MEENIEIISNAIVKPKIAINSAHKFVVDYTNRGLLFLKPTTLQLSKLKNDDVIDHLKNSLSKTLEIFPPFAGCLATIENEDKTASFFIDCNDTGAWFVHAVAKTLTVADILDSLYVPSFVHSFFLMNGVYNFEGLSKPLLAVQVTELVDGIFIGFTYNHAIADGTSFWDFVNTLSDMSVSCEKKLLQTSRPVLGFDWFLDGIDHPIRVPFSYNETISNRFISPPLVERIFHFSQQKIAQLKTKANADRGTSKISSLQAILGQLWRSIIRPRNLDSDQEIYCRVLVNMRQRLQPPLPDKYFGNAVLFGTAATTAGEMLANGLGFAAFQINKMVARLPDSEVRKYLEGWVKRATLSKLSSAASNALIVASSPRFNVFANDFGWGRPVAVRGGAGNNYDGKITVFPGVEEGSVDIQACLLPEIFHAMEEDAEFMDAIST